jgi:hypothetical protein
MGEMRDNLFREGRGVEEKALRSYKVLQASSACPSRRSNIKIMALERSTLLA